MRGEPRPTAFIGVSARKARWGRMKALGLVNLSNFSRIWLQGWPPVVGHQTLGCFRGVQPPKGMGQMEEMRLWVG